MKKKALTTVALGAATLAAGMAGNVHADSVKVTKQQIGDETKITTTTTKDVNQQKIAQDKQNISSQQTVVSSAKSSLDKAKVNASSASQVVSSAQSKVDDTKKALDAAKASQPDQIKHQVATDQSQVNTDKQNISSTQSSITTDKNNIDKDQQAINNVGQKAQQDQNKLNNDQSKLSSAQSTLNNDQNKLNNVNGQLSNLQGQNQNYPEIYVTAIGKEYLKALAEGDISVDGSVSGTFAKYLKDHNISLDKYILVTSSISVKFPDSKWSSVTWSNTNVDQNHDPVSGERFLDFDGAEDWVDGHNGGYRSKSDDYVIDPTNLTSSQMKEANIYATELINEFRAVAGLKPLKLTQSIIDNAAKVAEKYNANNWNMQEHNGGYAGSAAHDMDAIRAGGFDSECGFPGEVSLEDRQAADQNINSGNFGAYSQLATHYTMNDLKSDIALAVVKFLDQADGHAQMVMDPNADAMGLSIDKYGDMLLDEKVFKSEDKNMDPNKEIEEDKKFDIDPSKDPDLQEYKQWKAFEAAPNLVDTDNSASQVANLQKEASQLQDQVNKDKQVVNDLQNQVNADKAQLQEDTPAGLQQQLQNDQKKLADDQATLQKQQQKLAQDEAQLKADQNKLNSITPEDIANARKALEQAQTNYNNAVKALNEAQSKANVSNDELAKAQQNYINALNKLNELKQILENDEKQITTTSVQWIKNQHPTTTSSMGNKVVLHSSSEANTVHADTVSAVKDAIHFTSEAPVSSKKAAKKNTLPQMGDENLNKTVWGEISLAMAGVLATLGLADRKRRN